MRAKARKWGNSLAIRIPKAIADQAGVREDDELYIVVKAETILIKPQRREPTLAQLLEDITPENLHGEVDTGPSQGREAW
ncbi:MAG: AbrB/MazE/SpoVT family DNA-binding domain-containing protein [Gammaproteobacteria bacterium]|nr:AbrB/MazE/SpoVT family DNA-binding domain-containing protein [Gammaproteobacteria bacterium]